MIKINFFKNYWDIRKRIKSLPKYLKKSIDTIVKEDAESVIEEYQEGIRNNNFGLFTLHPLTIRHKKLAGYKKPKTPLYGAGDSEKNSYINAFEIKKKFLRGYKIILRKQKHHKASLTLLDLFQLHEHGFLVKRGETIQRVPPRPTRKKSWKRFLEKRLREEKTQEVRQAIINYLQTGNWKGRKKKR